MPIIAPLDAEDLARPERRAELPFRQVLRLYLDPSPLFKNASIGTRSRASEGARLQPPDAVHPAGVRTTMWRDCPRVPSRPRSVRDIAPLRPPALHAGAWPRARPGERRRCGARQPRGLPSPRNGLPLVSEAQSSTRNTSRSPSKPLSAWCPRDSRRTLEPASRSLVVQDASTSLSPARERTRAAACTAPP